MAGLVELLRQQGLEKLPLQTWVRRPEILLHPNIPAPLHGLAPRNLLGGKWWNATKQAAYQTTAYHCVACGVAKEQAEYRQWLEAHECYDVDYSAGRAYYRETVPLCHMCHNYVHDGRLKWLLETGKIHHAKFRKIMTHGDEVLTLAGLEKANYLEREIIFANLVRAGKVAQWGQWRLVVEGKEYLPLYKTRQEWEAAKFEEHDGNS